MAFTYIEGDLIKSDERVLIHGCNACGKFGSGFAGALRRSHPPAARVYEDVHRRSGLLLGSVLWALDGDRLVGNAVVQPTYGRVGTGRHVSYEALDSALRTVAAAAALGVPGTPYSEGFDRVAMPLIGAGLGGGDWREIEAVATRRLAGLDVAVYVLPGRDPRVDGGISRPRR